MHSSLPSRVRAVNIWLMAPLLGLALFLAFFVSASPAQAATSSYLNFQARLLNSTGGVVPDGSYNIDFKIYNADSTTGTVGSCSGACLWEETRTNAGGHGVSVVDGYFSVNLGSVTAFPSTINWDQPLWLTMNLTTNGTMTGAPTSGNWDGEMQNSGHSIALTALPYSFIAGQLAKTDGSGNRGTLSFNTVATNPAILLPDASGTVCLQGSGGANGCGYEGTAGTDFIQNNAGGPQTANYNIQSAATGSIGAVIQGASGQTADLFQLKNSTTVLSVGNNGQTLFKPTASHDSTTFFQVQSAGSGSLLNIDSSNSNISLLGNNSGETGVWTTSANSLPAANDSHGSVAANGYLYVVGGENGGTATGSVYYAKLNADGTTGAWQSETQSLPVTRRLNSALAVNGYIYSIGGTDVGTTAYNTVYYAKLNADGTTGPWQLEATTLPGARKNHGSFTVNGYIYVVGGDSAAGSPTSSVYYAKVNADGTTGAWQTDANSLTIPLDTVEYSTLTANGYVYVVGGATTSGTKEDTVYYDGLNSNGSLTGAWQLSANHLPDPMNQISGTVANGYLYAIGGKDASGVVSTVYYSKLNSGGTIGVWKTAVNNLTTAQGAQDAGGASFYNGYIYVTGGFTTSSVASVIYAPTSRLQVGGSIDLVGLSGGSLTTNNGGGGSLTAGNTKVIGSLSVQGQTTLNGYLAANNGLNVNGGAQIKGAASTSNIFNVQNAGGLNVLSVSTVNLIGNGNFENGISGEAPDGWTAKATGTLTVSTTKPQFGSNSMKIVAAAAGDGATYFVPLLPSTQYTFSFYAATSSGTVNINFGDQETGSDIDCATTITINTTISRKSCTFTTGATISGTPNVYIKTTSAAGTFFVDGVQLELGASATLFREGDLTVSGQSIFTSFNNSSTAFQVQNSSGTNIFNIDTSNSLVGTIATSLASTNSQDFSIRTGNATGSTSNSGNLKLDVGTATGTTGQILIGTVNNASLITIGSSTQTGTITLGQSSASNTISIGSAAGSGNTQTINLGADSTSGSTTNVNIGSTAGGSTTVKGASTTAFQVQNSSGSSLLTIDTQNSIINVGTDLATHTINVANGPSGLGIRDNFNRANGSLNSSTASGGGTWSNKQQGGGSNTLNITSNAVTGSTGSIYDDSYLTNSYGPDSEAYVTISTVGNSGTTEVAALYLRVNSAGGGSATGYELNVTGNGTWQFWRMNSPATFVTLGSTFSQAISAGDEFGFRVTGTSTPLLEAWYKPLGGSWTQLSTFTDNFSLTPPGSQTPFKSAGFIDLETYGTAPRLDDLRGGNADTQTVNIGTNSASSVLNLQSGTGSINISSGGSTTVKPLIDSTTVFQIQNAAGNNVLSVDTASNTSQGQIVLGTASTNNGTIVFDNSAGSGTATITLAGNPAANYVYQLPTTSVSSGQCLQAGTLSGNNVPLTFGACGASGTFLNKNATDTSSANAGSGYLYGFTNSGSSGSGGVLSLDNGTNTGTVLNVKGTSTTALQVQNSSSQRVLGVDTSNKDVILGQSSAINGALLFQNSSSSNAITINSTATSSNYTLTLPTVAPAGGLCIETSTGNSSQLIFASCSNNNASIQEVHEWDANNTNVVSVSPSTAGDEMVLTTQIPTSSVTVSSVSGGGVTTWNKVIANAGNGTVNRVEMWAGTVTSTGSSNITVTYSSSPGIEEVAATEFTAAGVNSNTSWGIESSASQLNSTASTTVTYPNMTAINGSELYVGYAQVQNPPSTAGSSTGFNYIITSTQHNVITYNTSLAANTAYQPTANQNSSGQSNTVAAILTAFVTSSSINNTTSLQKANFYVQAATSGTVAGVLEAASSGSADILDLRNSSAANVVSVSSTGNVAIQPAASSTALQVLDGNSYSVLTADTSGDQVLLGNGSHLSGKLTFSDSGDNNTISFVAPSSVATSYSLTLPSNTPTAGLCLGTSPSNANQLIFASCATQVSAASISYVNKWQNSGSGVTTISDSPTSVGDLLLLSSHTTNNVTINSISSGGVTNWTKITGNTGVTGGNVEMWRGVVTSTGASTITITYSSGAGTNDIVAQEFTMGSSSGTWAVDTSGTTNGTSATVSYPSLTPAASSELYDGYGWGANTMSAGSTTGYTYLATSASKYLAYNTNVTGGTAQAPTATQNTSGSYNSVAALIAAYAGTSVIVNSTAVQQANFDVQAATGGTVAGVLQAASSGTADIFQAKDSSGNNVMSINASSGVTLGTSNVAAGSLVFAASGNSNTITITAPTAPGASYSLTLPTTTPAAGQCLATSPSNANQLVFSSCANQVTSVSISFVNNWKSSSVTQNPTLSVSPVNIGDLITLFIYSSKGNTVTSVSGGGVTTWSKVVSANSEDMWRGLVTTTGSNTISVSVSTPASPTEELAAQEWTTGSSTGSWVVDTSNSISNTSSTTVTYPSLTPQSTKDLYVGYAVGTSTMSAGATSGYTYFAGAGTSIYGAYNTAVSTTTQPTASQASSGTSQADAALIAAYSSSSVIANSTVTQEANFNIQAATSGSVAGTLQAFSSGTGDILDMLNGTGTLVDSFGYTGNLLVEPSTASAAAFQVQTTGAVNVLSVDTSAKQVVIGKGSTGESSPSLLVVDNETGTSSDPTEVDGAIYYNATTRTFRCGEAGAWQNCSGQLFANSSQSSAISNCSSACTAFSTYGSIPANSCQAGRTYNLFASGYFSSQATASNLQFGVYYGTDSSIASNDVLLGTLPAAEAVSSASNNYFQINFTIICFSTSSMMANGSLSLQVGAAASGLTVVPMNSTSGTTVVTTSSKNVYIFPIWGTASSSNTSTLAQYNLTTP